MGGKYTTSVLPLVLVASISCAATSHVLQPWASRVARLDHSRFLEEDDEVTCEFVDTNWLGRLLAGHENFVNDLRKNGNNDNNSRRQRKRRLQNLQNTTTTPSTVLVASVAPSSDSDADNDNKVPPPTVQMFSHSEGGRFIIQVSTEDGSGNTVLTDVKKDYQIAVHQDDVGNDDSVVMSSSLLVDETGSVQEFVKTNNFRAIAISGKFFKANGKKARYQALVVGMDSDSDDAGHANSYKMARNSIFLFIDKRSAKKSMKRAKREVSMTDNDDTTVDVKLGAKSVACLDPSQEIDADCEKQVGEEYRVAEAVLKEPFQASLQALGREVAELDTLRFQDLYRIAARCATQVGTPWDPRSVMDCIEVEKPRFYESFLVDFGSLRNDIQSQTVTRNVEVEKLKLGRNSDIRTACCRSASEEDESNRRRLKRLGQEDDNRLPMDPTQSITGRTTVENRRLPQPARLGETPAAAPSSKLHHRQRRLQDASTAANTCQYIAQIDEAEVSTLTDFPEDLYRSLTASADETTSAPSDAFVTKGYNTNQTQAQELKFQKDTFTVEVRQATVVELDVTALVKRRNGAPREVRRYVKDGEFEALVVEGSQTQAGGTEIQFVGVIFSRIDKKKQLLWPVDSGSLEVFTVRRTLWLQRRRSLQTVESASGTVQCTATQTLSQTCVTDSQDTFEQLRLNALEKQESDLRKIDEEIVAVNLERLDSVRFAGAECAAALGVWNVTLLSGCLQDEKMPEITREYLANLLELNNEAVRVAIDTAAVIAQGRVERDNALVACCEVDTMRPSSAPTGRPTQAPFQTPTANTSQSLNSPTAMPSQVPTIKPTKLPSAAPTEAPSVSPSNRPSPGPGNPTMLPVVPPSQTPTFSPSTALPTTLPSSLPSPTEAPSGSPSNRPSPGPGNPTMAPVVPPSPSPTASPSTALPTTLPSSVSSPTEDPSISPSNRPSPGPGNPTMVPVVPPSPSPTVSPSTTLPTTLPSSLPFRSPTVSPTALPTSAQPKAASSMPPTSTPSSQPTKNPSLQPTASPFVGMTTQPTIGPSVPPTTAPSLRPTRAPSVRPTASPYFRPTASPSVSPTAFPSVRPTTSPSVRPKTSPSVRPTTSPSARPTTSPLMRPTTSPSVRPTTSPSVRPTTSPSVRPTTSPSVRPTTSPSVRPTTSPSVRPTTSPSARPTTSPSVRPTTSPSVRPTTSPLERPTTSPSVGPTASPSAGPTASPSSRPTASPSTRPTSGPSSRPTSRPTASPSRPPTSSPSHGPTSAPTVSPTHRPTNSPTSLPTSIPTISPTNSPTSNPTSSPSRAPTSQPSSTPTNSPSRSPSAPTRSPTTSPTTSPTSTSAPTSCSTAEIITLDFEEFASGLLASDAIDGVTISAYRSGVETAVEALVMTSANSNQVLAVPDDSETDSHSRGGRLDFHFEAPGVVPFLLRIVGGGNGGTAELIDAEGVTINTQTLPTGSVDQVVLLGNPGLTNYVSRILRINFKGIGALDAVGFYRLECSP